MMKAAIQSIRQDVRAMGDKAIAAHSQQYFKTGKGGYGEGDRFLGIRVPALRKLARKYKGIGTADAADLLRSRYHEERLLALLILVEIYNKADAKNQKRVYDLYLKSTRWINNWDLVDTSAKHIVGAYLKDRNRKPLYSLAKSKDLWERRIAIMATFYFIKLNDFTDTLSIAEILIADEEDLIHKAVGWMLREVGNRDIETEERFLKSHYLKMPRTMLRYAIEKFPESKRKQYLAGTIDPHL